MALHQITWAEFYLSKVRNKRGRIESANFVEVL